MHRADCTLTKERTPLSPRFQFLHDQPVFHVAHARAAVPLEAGPEKAEFGHGFHQFAGEPSFAIALLDDGDEVLFNKAARGIAHQPLVVAEQGVEFHKVHSPEFKGGHGLSLFAVSKMSVEA